LGVGDFVGQPGTTIHTYHVDATRGDDARDGLSPGTAWRSLTRVNKARLQPGDHVLFRRGETWHGQLIPQSGGEAGAITYGAFGEGDKPALLGSLAMNCVPDWQPAGPGIWATAPIRFDQREVCADLGKSRWSLHHEGDATCAMTPLAGGYRLECKSPGARGNYLQLSVDGLHVHEGEYYQFTFHASCSKPFTPEAMRVMKADRPWTAYASPIKHLPEIGIEATEYALEFQAVTTADDGRLTLYLGGLLPAGATLDWQPNMLYRAECNQPVPLSVDVGNIIFDHGAAVGVKKWRITDLLQEGDYFYDGQRRQVLLRSAANPASRHRSIELALNRHIINESGRGYVTYENLALRYGAAHGIGGGNTQHITVRDCEISFIGGGRQGTLPGGKPVRFGNGVEFWAGAHDCLVEGCRLWEIYDAALTNQGDGTNVQENITYQRNVIWNSEYSFEYWNRDRTSKTRNIRFQHNTCVNAGFGWGHKQRPDPNGRHLMFYDNTATTEAVFVCDNIFCNATDSCLRLHGRDWTASLTMDRNCWFQSQGPILLWGRQQIGPEQFDSFQRQHGLDTHSKVSDPKFVARDHNDYRLTPESPARAIERQGLPVGALP
jgi:hypothetical protein